MYAKMCLRNIEEDEESIVVDVDNQMTKEEVLRKVYNEINRKK